MLASPPAPLLSKLMFDVLIIGGSYAGLSAALALGRARRSVLV
ncbi:MAG: NAD(P)/FAD-dependent oxidoreductase, partial [Hymenobacter sp.]